ncbi:Endonuclease-1 precursor [Morganella morganii]|nr:Endonuclease-1 precursor [Morganella morganii]
MAREKIYYDQNRNPQGEGTLYCGCQWEWTGKSGGRVDLNSCGYRVRSQLTRAERIEWEHIVPAWVFGHQRQCWQNGGRKNCVSEDPVFRAMEADLHNLAPSVGEVNGDRSNFRYGIARGAGSQSYGQCTSRVDFKQRVFEPRDEVKGEVARVWFYMHDRYDLAMSEQQQKLLMVWDSEFPPSAAERERDRRIRAVTGQSNPFVTGERRWEPGHINSADGIFTRLPSVPVTPVNVPPQAEKSLKISVSAVTVTVRFTTFRIARAITGSAVKMLKCSLMPLLHRPQAIVWRRTAKHADVRRITEMWQKC